MDLGSAETWRWIWLALAVAFTVAELSTVTFFILPFAIGAALAAASAFAGLGLAGSWLVFVAVSGAASALLIPYGRRLDRTSPPAAIGAHRCIGKDALVLADIPGPPGTTGLVRVEREEWRAESMLGLPIPAGSTVVVRRIDGTRLIVVAVSDPTLDT